MAITKINNVLVKHGKIMFGVITAIIIVAFVWFFTPGADGSILFGTNPNSPDAVCGDIAGTPVVNKDITDLINSITLVQAAELNRAPGETRIDYSFEKLFPTAVMYKTAQKMGAVVADKDVAKMIRSLPAFQKDGKFSKDLYIKYESEKLQPAGYNAKDLEDAVRVILMINEVANSYDNDVLSPAEIQEALKNDLTTAEALAIVFTADKFKPVNPAEKELKAFYESNKASFKSPEKYKGNAVVFYYKDYKVNEKEAKAYYDKNKKTLINPADGKQMTYNQFKTDYIKQQQTQLAVADAKAFREKVYQATTNIAGNKKAYLNEYAKLAATQKKLIQIGWFSGLDKALPGVGEENMLKGALVMKAKDNAPVTDPVIGEKAVYVAAITDIQEPAPMAYTVAKADVKAKYIEEKTAAKLQEAVGKFRSDMAAAVKEKKKIDKKFIENLVKGKASVTAIPPVRTADIKKTVLGLQKQMQELSSQKLNPQEMGMRQLQAQLQIQSAMMQLQRNAPVLETAAGALSKVNSTATETSMFFVTKRTFPTAKELKAHEGMFDSLYLTEKQQVTTASLYEWLEKNAKNHLQNQNAEQQKDVPAAKK